jgi:hypothetical protein
MRLASASLRVASRWLPSLASDELSAFGFLTTIEVLMHAGWDRTHSVTSRASLAATPNIELATP